MPRGPKGEKRPADVVANAVHIMRIATGEIEDTKRSAGAEANRKGGVKGAKVRAERLSPAERKAIAKKAAASRWGKQTVAAQAKKERQEH